MKAIITSDWHVGVRGDSDLFHDIFLTWVSDFLIPNIEKEKAEHLFMLGDFFNNRNTTNNKTINVAIEAIDKIFEVFPDLTISILAGNHDLYYKSSRDISSLRILENRYENLSIEKEIYRVTLGNKKFVLCPWLVSPEEVDELFSKKADICLGHFEINDFRLVGGIKEKKGLSPAKFRKTFGKTFSGHFHINQEDDNITYVGNPFETDWKDYNNEKVLYVLDCESGDVKTISNNISPKHVKVYLSQIKNGSIELKTLKNSFVKLIIDDDCTEKGLKKIQDVIYKKNPLSLDIEGFNEDANIVVGDMENDLTSPFDYLVSFIQDYEDFPDSIDKDELVKMTTGIYNKVVV